MKYLLFGLIFSLALGACGDDSLCTTETVVGTYSGTNECPENITVNTNDVGDITLEVRHIEGDKYVTQFASGATVGFSLRGCDISIPKDEALTPAGIKIETLGSGSFIGDDFTLNIQTIVDGVEFTCSASVTKN